MRAGQPQSECIRKMKAVEGGGFKWVGFVFFNNASSIYT